jgi:hypothetical protein
MRVGPISRMALACCGQDLEALNRPWIRVGILAGTGGRRPGSVLNSSKSRWRGDLRIVRRGRNGCTVFWWPSLESDFQASNQHSPWRSSRRESLTSPPRASSERIRKLSLHDTDMDLLPMSMLERSVPINSGGGHNRRPKRQFRKPDRG